jgi:hypothetical protein
LFIHPLYPYRRVKIGLLKEWVKFKPITSPEVQNGTSYGTLVCPLLNGQGNNEDPNQIKMLTVGGFVSNSPKKSFLDLVSKTHKRNKGIKDVIITDRFIYSEKSEDGMTGGYSNVVEYLKTLGLEKDDKFNLVVNPHAKSTPEKIKLFQKYIKDAFPNVSFDTYHRENYFHDRFYLVRDTSGQINGVFGPSLNGLNSESIVIMGDIKDKGILSKLNKKLT